MRDSATNGGFRKMSSAGHNYTRYVVLITPGGMMVRKKQYNHYLMSVCVDIKYELFIGLYNNKTLTSYQDNSVRIHT